MSFRGGGRGGGGGGRGGGGFRGGRGRGGGGRGGFGYRDQGPPDYVEEIGFMKHTCENDLVVKGTHDKIPYFNAPIYLENKSQIGKVDEIFGAITDYFFSVKLSDNMKADSFNKDAKFYIDPAKLLPLSRFLPKPGQRGAGKRGGPGGRGGRGRGGFDRGRGGRGGFNRGGGGGFNRGGGGGFNRGGGGGFNRGGRGGGGGFRGGRGGGFNRGSFNKSM